MNEDHFGEIEKVLLFVSSARERADKAARTVARTDAEPHLVTALQEAEEELTAIHKRLMQSTYFAVPEHQLSI